MQAISQLYTVSTTHHFLTQRAWPLCFSLTLHICLWWWGWTFQFPTKDQGLLPLTISCWRLKVLITGFDSSQISSISFLSNLAFYRIINVCGGLSFCFLPAIGCLLSKLFFFLPVAVIITSPWACFRRWIPSDFHTSEGTRAFCNVWPNYYRQGKKVHWCLDNLQSSIDGSRQTKNKNKALK